MSESQNAAARLVPGAKWRDYNTPVLEIAPLVVNTMWLYDSSAPYRLEKKNGLLTQKSDEHLHVAYHVFATAYYYYSDYNP